MMFTPYYLALLLVLFTRSVYAASCGEEGIFLQVLGSGGPELGDERASSGYLVWENGQARVLVDIGPGSMLSYEHSRARLEDLDVVLLSHLHVDHSADLSALVKASFFTDRKHDLPLFGPTGNRLMPDTVTFVDKLFLAGEGTYRYLSDFLSGDAAYRIIPGSVSAEGREQDVVIDHEDLRVSAIPVHHGPIPALAWRVEIGGKVLVFSGDMNGDYQTLPNLAKGADLLVAHNAVPESATGVARNLHMPPSVIGKIAGEAGVHQLILSHRMLRTLGRETESKKYIQQNYTGSLAFADDGDCYSP